MRRALTIGVLALLGLAAAVAITMAASSLSSQSIGLSDEPLDAGDALAVPAPGKTRSPRPQPTQDAAPPSTTAPPATTDQTSTSGDGTPDDSGSGRSGSDDSGGRGSGSGSDDSGSDD
jgi:hypothetical protein